jgi:hypothetical protein
MKTPKNFKFLPLPNTTKLDDGVHDIGGINQFQEQKELNLLDLILTHQLKRILILLMISQLTL